MSNSFQSHPSARNIMCMCVCATSHKCSATNDVAWKLHIFTATSSKLPNNVKAGICVDVLPHSKYTQNKVLPRNKPHRQWIEYSKPMRAFQRCNSRWFGTTLVVSSTSSAISEPLEMLSHQKHFQHNQINALNFERATCEHDAQAKKPIFDDNILKTLSKIIFGEHEIGWNVMYQETLPFPLERYFFQHDFLNLSTASTFNSFEMCARQLIAYPPYWTMDYGNVW